MRPDRALRLLDIVARATTNEGEAVNAARQLSRMAESAGGIERLLGIDAHHNIAVPQLRVTSFTERKREISDLERKLADSEHARRELQSRLNHALQELASVRSELSRSAKPATTTPRRAAFSPDEVLKIRTWAREFSDHSIAELASSDFGRSITTDMIKRLRVDIKAGNGAYADRISYGRPLPTCQRDRAESFPWSKYPDFELEVCESYIDKNDNYMSASDMANYLSTHTGLAVTEGMVKQRRHNNAPPRSLISAIPKNGPLTWKELWFIGALMGNRAWGVNIKKLFQQLELPSLQVRDPLTGLTPENIEAIRQYGRSLSSFKGQTKTKILEIVKQRGIEGITRKELIEMDPASAENIIKRLNELIPSNTLFEVGDKIVHQAFRESYPEEWDRGEKRRLSK